MPSAWRNAIVGLVDDAEDGVRLSSSGVFHKPENRAYEGLLGHLLQSGSVSLSALALHHVGELGLEGLDVEVDALKDQASMLFGEAAKTSCLAWAKPLPSGGA